VNGAQSHYYLTLDGGVLKKAWGLFKLNIKLYQTRPDIVVSECQLAPLNFKRYTLIHVIHDAKFVTRHGRGGRKFVRLLHWISAKISTAVMTVSFSERERIADALGIPADRIIVSYNGLSPAWGGAPTVCQKAVRYDVIYVSNLAPHKGHSDLVHACAGTSWRILFVGADFGMKERIRCLAEDLGVEVIFREGVPEEELIELYDQSQVFAFPSRIEGFGIPFLEARARGLRVVANDIPIFRELQSKLGGNLVDVSNAELFRRSLARAMAEPKGRADISGFFWSAIASDLLRVIRDLK
jgi:glycosyltransferase involved in cell wall biosynthesis